MLYTFDILKRYTAGKHDAKSEIHFTAHLYCKEWR